MLLSLEELITTYGLRINGVVHGGAHLAEEADEYERLGVGPVWWIEANPEVIPEIKETLARYPDQCVIEALLYEEDDVELDFHVTNYKGMSSSVYPFGTHPEFSPDTVFVNHLKLKTTTLDTLVDSYGIVANFLNLDLQGAEGPALRGASRLLQSIDVIYSEVNDCDVYQGCTKIWELDALLKDFKRFDTYWVPGQGWGDSLYLAKRIL